MGKLYAAFIVVDAICIAAVVALGIYILLGY